MSVFDSSIDKLGSVYTLKQVTESVDEKGYSTKIVSKTSVKCIFNELTGLEMLWETPGLARPGDAQVYFKSNQAINIGDIIEDEDYQEWEIIQFWKRKWLNQVQCIEAIARKK